MGALLLAFLVGVFSASPFGERDVAYAQTAGASDLSNLVLMSGSRVVGLGDTGFAFNDYQYGDGTAIPVPHSPSSLRVSATPNVPGSPVKVYSSTTSGSFTAGAAQSTAIDDSAAAITRRSLSNVPIDIGENHIAIEVASLADSPVYSVYVITINRLSSTASSSADLTGLTLTVPDTSFSPAPDKDVLNYSARVPNGTASVTVTPTVSADATFAVTSSRGASKVDNSTPASPVVTLDTGSNVITIKVTAQNLVATKTYTLTVTKAASSASDDASLSSLTVGSESVNLSGFNGTVHEVAGIDYETGVSNGTSSMMISATPTDSGAMVVIRTGVNITTATTTADLVTAGSADADGRVHLSVGINDIAIVVIPENAEATDTRVYLLRIRRAAAGDSSSADLTGLTLADNNAAAVNFSPDPDKDILNYSARVPNGTASVTVTPTVSANATFAVTSDRGAGKVDNATPTAPVVTLDTGSNVISIKVTAQNLVATKTYTLTVTKAASNASDDASLSSLMVGGESVNLSGFDGSVHAEAGIDYETGVSNGTSSIEISATPNYSGAAVVIRTGIDIATNTTTAALAGDGSVDADGMVALSPGEDNDIAIVVIPENAEATDTRVYLLRIRRAAAGDSSSADLTGLTLTVPDTNFSPAPDKDILNYSARVPNGTASVTVTPTVSADATFAVTSSRGASKVDNSTPASPVVTLDTGSNVISIKVTAQNLVATKTYTLTVTKAASNASDDASLSSLMVGGESVSLSGFDGSVHAEAGIDYMAGVSNGTSSIEISATPNHSGAAVVIRTGIDIATNTTTAALAGDGSADADGMVALSPGEDNDIAIVVIPENAAADDTRVYLLRIRRASANDSDDAKLDDLTLTRITLSPIFASNTTMYSVSVLDSITSTTVTATADLTATSVVIMSDRDDSLGADLDATNAANITSHSVDLSPGDNVITVMVTAQDYETMETYTVTIVRGASNNAYLSSLSLMDDMGMEVTLVAGVAAHWDTLNCPEMNDRVGADDQPDNMNSPYCRMYAGLDDAAKMVVDQTYADDPIEGFMANIGMYYASVANDVDMVTVSAMAADSDAMVSGAGDVSLDVGDNTVEVMVTAEDGTTMMTYTVMVNRPGSSDAYLSSLSLMGSDGMAIGLMDMDGMAVDFSSSTMMYYASVSSDVTMATVSAMAMDSGAMVSGDGSHDLMVGENTITVTVTAEDGTMMTYTVMVTVVEPMTDEERLLAEYDTMDNDGNLGADGSISAAELNVAIDEYLEETLSADDLNILIDLYLEG